MNKEEYLEIIKKKTGITKKDIESVINEFLELLKTKLSTENKVNITNFGTFSVKVTKPFTLFSPLDGRKIKTSGIKKIFFSSSKELLNRISR